MIYLLEDDDNIRKLVVYALETQGFKATGFATPHEFFDAMAVELPELLLLDIMLPEMDGMTILQQLRHTEKTARIPVIMLTAKNTEYDRVMGLDSGADDYISKPFSTMELVARVRALLRRFQPVTQFESDSIGVLSINTLRHEVHVNDELIALTNKEFSLLEILLKNKGMVMTRQVLMERIWGLDNERDNRTLDVHIRTLRSKLKEAGSYIETVRGLGYRMKDVVA